MFAQLSLTSMTSLGDAQELFSTLGNDSWASCFNYNLDFMLMTSCHCSLSPSSSKHHACSSSSSSRTSSLKSPSPSFTAFRLLFQLAFWCNLPQCVLFSQCSSKLGCHPCHLSLVLFLLSCLRSWITARSALLAAVGVFLYTPTGTLPPPFHPPLDPVSWYTACTESSDVFPYPSATASSPSVSATMPIFFGALVSIFFALDTECVVTLSMMFSSAMNKSSCDIVVQRKSIVQQTLGHQPFQPPESSLRLGFPKASFVLVRLVDEVPESVVELLHVLCTITFTVVTDQRCICRASV